MTQWGGGRTNIFDCAADGDLDGLKQRIANANVKIDPRDQQGRTPLIEAARYGHLACIEVLVERGADVNLATPDGQCALHCAAQNGHDAIITYLIKEKDVDVNVKDKHGDAAIHIAAGAGKLSTIRLLLELGATKDAKNLNGMTPADCACDAATTELFKEGSIQSITNY